MSRLTFRGELMPARGGGALVPIPAPILEALGGSARVRVTGTLAGVEFQSSTMPTGAGAAALGVHKATRERAGVGFGDVVEITLERDDRPRPIDVPAPLGAALDADPEARQAFQRLSPTQRREQARWVADARRVDTVERRVAATLERLRSTP